MKNCPAQKLQVKLCCGHCQCICPKPPVKINLNKNNQKQIKNDDPRIPHSLDTKPRDESSFDAHKYETKQQQIKMVKKGNKIQIQKVKPNQQPKNQKQLQKSQQFPQVPKILTYSNLGLNYDDPQLKQQLKNYDSHQQQKHDHVIQMIETRKQLQRKNKISLLQKQKNQISSKPISSRQNVNIASSVQDSQYQIKAKPVISKQQLLKQFYGAENSPFKSNYEPIKPKDSQDNFYMKQQTQREKLSRVINLDKQLDQVNLRGPPLLPYATNTGDLSQLNGTNFVKYGKRMPSKSNMMLSLYIEINKNQIFLPTKQPFIIAYRPYGQKQRLTLGPQFADTISILSLVGESQVKKMGKTPFIIQFWSATNNKFIGLIKINLSKIKQGFILQDRLNEMAIKTNILPTTIQRGDSKIIDLTDKQVGICSIYAAIGTSNQLNTYLNQKQSSKVPTNQKSIKNSSNNNNAQVQDPQKQPHNPKKQISPIQINTNNIHSKSILTNYDSFLEHIYKNNDRVIDVLNHLMNQRYIKQQQLQQLAKNISILPSQINPIINLHKQLLKIYSNSDLSNNDHASSLHAQLLDFHIIAQCFDTYIQTIQTIKQNFNTNAKIVHNLFADPASVFSKLKQQTPMQTINRNKVQEIMCKYCQYGQPIKEFVSMFNQYVAVDLLSLCLSPKTNLNKHLQLPDILTNINKQYINQIILQKILNIIDQQHINSIRQYNKQQNKQNIINVLQLYRVLDGKISVWMLLHLWEHGKKIGYHVGSDRDGKESYIDARELVKFIQNCRSKLNIQVNNKQKSPQQILEQVIQHPQSLQHSQQANINQPSHHTQIHPQNNNIIPKQILQPQIKPSPHIQPQKQSQIKLRKHLFTIQPTQLILDQPPKSNMCTVVYEFPFQQEQVKSKSFPTTSDKHRYNIKMYGTHGFTIAQNVQNYIGDAGIKFYVLFDKRIQYEGQLPSDQLLIKENTQENKIIPLFGNKQQGIVGRIKMSINYQSILASDNMLGKQTTYQLFLPKTGYLNYSILCQLQPSKLRSQLNLKQQFYLCLTLDVFHSNSSLHIQFPPISSKLHPETTELLQLSGSIKLSLTPVILQYLKNSHAKLSLMIIYYSKQSRNFQRKQLPYANIELPLISVIKAEGIKGNYAFKNKFGMFVTLAQCSIKYEKQQNRDVNHANRLGLSSDKQRERGAYWVIVNFLQFLNFEERKFTWIKMQFVIKARKYSTQKIHLQQYSINFLHNAHLLLKFTQQQFMDTKMIPVTILTNTSQKLAIDINLKNLSKQLIHKKYSINNQNYVVVNEASKATKMRLAVKTYIFRGGPLLTSFINSLYQHLDTQVFQQLQYPEQVQNYEQILNIFKNNLKLSQKALNQALSQLDLNKNKQKLNFQFFTNRTYYRLDFTPILAQNQADIDFICQQLHTETNKQDIIQYLSDNKIKLQNFRPQFLDRFMFKQLNKSRADKNVQFLCIEPQIDLISFIRKIRILDGNNTTNKYVEQNSYLPQNSTSQQKLLQLAILQGAGFNQLYNGIKPNSLIRIPQIGLQTHISHRNSNPLFNQNIQVELNRENVLMLRNLKVQVYHCTSSEQDEDDEDAQNILIGQGYLKVNTNQIKSNNAKVYKVVINSLMSNKMKASLNIKLHIFTNKKFKNNNNKDKDSSIQQIQDSADVSRFGQIMHDIKQQMEQKNKLFQSSDQDQQ